MTKRIPRYLQNKTVDYNALRYTLLAYADFYEVYPEGYEVLDIGGKWEYAILNFHGLKRNQFRACYTCANYDIYNEECLLMRTVFPHVSDISSRLAAGNPKRSICNCYDTDYYTGR